MMQAARGVQAVTFRVQVADRLLRASVISTRCVEYLRMPVPKIDVTTCGFSDLAELGPHPFGAGESGFDAALDS